MGSDANSGIQYSSENSSNLTQILTKKDFTDFVLTNGGMPFGTITSPEAGLIRPLGFNLGSIPENNFPPFLASPAAPLWPVSTYSSGTGKSIPTYDNYPSAQSGFDCRSLIGQSSSNNYTFSSGVSSSKAKEQANNDIAGDIQWLSQSNSDWWIFFGVSPTPPQAIEPGFIQWNTICISVYTILH